MISEVQQAEKIGEKDQHCLVYRTHKAGRQGSFCGWWNMCVCVWVGEGGGDDEEEGGGGALT